MAAKPSKPAKKLAPKAKAAPKPAKAPKASAETIDILNVNHPGKTHRVNAAKYAAARKALLALMPKTGPGLTQAEMGDAMRKALPGSEWGTTQGWWMKGVQLDAEARGEVVRDGGKPLRWRKVK